MITIHTFEEIIKLDNITENMKEELLQYFREIAEGIVGEQWQMYNLEEVGPILVIEKNDSIDVLKKYNLIKDNKSVPQLLPEFALRVEVGDTYMFKVIWVFSDCFGISMYYPIGKFGQEFDEFVKEYLIEQ